MVSSREMPVAARRYLEELERCLKRQVGVSPEEALSDAREFVLSATEGLERSGDGLSEEELYLHFTKTFGEPAVVAEQYARGGMQAIVRPTVLPRTGYAPGWRICCTKCGRSAPLAALGGVRIGARSVHKYTVGWCRECGWFRWLRIIQDLDEANLTERMGVTKTPQESLKGMHRPVLTLVGILLMTLAIMLGTWAILAAVGRGEDAAVHGAAVQRLRKAVEQEYSHRDRKGVDWAQRFGEYEPRLKSAGSAQEFASQAAELLATAEDIHLWLNVGGTVVPTYRRNLAPNFNPRVLPRLIPTLKQHGKTVLVGQFEDGIRYVAIGTWENREPEAMEAAISAVSEAAVAKAPLIVDVRPNTGGDERTARRVAAFFVSEPTVYAKHTIRRSGADLPVQERVLQPQEKGIRHPGPCVVLMGPANISSCEAFLLMMRAGGCRLIGEKSFGASGNPQAVDLGNGVTAFVPSWRSLDSMDRELEGAGIEPDVRVEAKPGDFQQTDAVLKKALEVLRSGG